MISSKLSKLIAGTMLWGKWGKNFSCREMASMIEHCVENGISSFDHADIYGGYTTESDFGHGLLMTSVQRSDIQLISKCGIKMIADNRDYQVKHYDYSKQHIISSCENSLTNLKTDYLDVFLLHRPSPLMQANEIAEAISQLMQQGKILSFGVSNFTDSQTEILRQYIPIKFNQIEFSLTKDQAMFDGSLDYMQIHQIQAMAWAPLGTIFKNSTNPALVAFIDDLKLKYNVEVHVILLNWILRHPAHILPVIGTTNKSRIEQLKEAYTFEMELEDWFELMEIAKGHRVP